MQKVPQSICANAGIAPSVKLKMMTIRTDRTALSSLELEFYYQTHNRVV
jgi:hypothetical protein